METVGIVGLCLIGGSMALDLRRRGFARKVLGVETDPVNATAALKMGLCDEVSRWRNVSAGAALS